MAEFLPYPLTGRYSPVTLLGRGGMGSVFLAEDLSLGRRVAIKLPRSHGKGLAPEAEAAFQAEGRALARINHPSVVGVYDAGISDGTAYLVMEYLDGTDLSRLVAEEGPLSVATAATIAVRMLAGLEAAHANGVLHRDVKPQNVRVTAKGRVVLYDFGIAQLIEEPSGGNIVGTPQFLAPERLHGQATKATDLYGVGICLHYMLIGQHPFESEGHDPWLLLNRLVQEGVPALASVLPSLPPRFAAAVDMLCVRDPDDRPATAAEAANLLREWADEDERGLMRLLAGHRREPVPATGLVSSGTLPPVVHAPEAATLSSATRRLFHSRLTENSALSRNREAVGLILRGSLQEGADILAAVLPYCEEGLGPEHPTTLACQYWQAVCFAQRGEARAALELFSRVSAHTGSGRDEADA
ncbi:protein kinase [Streptomyces sp. NPDC060020]|uniref:serine/threonine-protein kinase n=1 Tax=Streptomyces sp. NPDC060020 TaxID=3347038 RepID=UPI003681328A